MNTPLKNFNLRGLDANLMNKLKKQAEKESSSVNTVILKLIEQGIGHTHKVNRPIYHDLDHLAGKWSATDAKKFTEATSDFEKIDKDMW